MAARLESGRLIGQEQRRAFHTDSRAGESGGIFSAGAATNRKRRSSAVAANGTRRENYADEVRPALETCSCSQRSAGLGERRSISGPRTHSPDANKSG